MSNVCSSGGCTRDQVGPFLEGITKACYDQGSCQLPDIMTVVANVGNYAVGIVGSLVFLMWVISGFRYLGANFLPGGFDENIKKGKQGIVTATVGLLIVFGAYAGIYALEAVLTAGNSCVALNKDETTDYRCVDTTKLNPIPQSCQGDLNKGLCAGPATFKCCNMKGL